MRQIERTKLSPATLLEQHLIFHLNQFLNIRIWILNNLWLIVFPKILFFFNQVVESHIWAMSQSAWFCANRGWELTWGKFVDIVIFTPNVLVFDSVGTFLEWVFCQASLIFNLLYFNINILNICHRILKFWLVADFFLEFLNIRHLVVLHFLKCVFLEHFFGWRDFWLH